MTSLFSGEVWVAYSQAYVVSDVAPIAENPDECFAGQANGLCGAGVPGMLFLRTGLHTGRVPVTVELLDGEPAMDGGWEEVVEVAFATENPELRLVGWAGSSDDPLGLEVAGEYRVRYCARGMDAGRAQDTSQEDNPAPDAYLLQFWPAPAAADSVVRQTSRIAGYWHEQSRSLPEPPAPEERALEQARAEEAVRSQYLNRQQEFEIAVLWGGRAPSPRLRDVAPVAHALARTDRDLLDELAALEPGTQRAVARWLARRAFEVAGIDTLAWARAGLDALDAGRPLPHPFVDLDEAFALVAPAPQIGLAGGLVPGGVATSTAIPGPTMPGAGLLATLAGPGEPQPAPVASVAAPAAVPVGPTTVHRPSMAIPALPAATAPDPLHALLDTLGHAGAAFHERQPELLRELRDRYLTHL